METREEVKRKLIVFYMDFMSDPDDPEDVRMKRAEHWAERLLAAEENSTAPFAKDWNGCP